MEDADFSGWATKAGLKCSDGRTITPAAFTHMDGKQVPLVWHHVHNEPNNVLGHAILEARDEGVYCYGFFNDTPTAQHVKGAVQHKDIVALSIYANELVEKARSVLHGAIKEVSLVISGANPGAVIENVRIAHSSDPDDIETYEDEAIITSGETIDLAHSDSEEEEENEDEVKSEDEAVQHADGEEPTVEEVYDSLTDKQKEVVHYMIGAALEGADTSSSTEAQHSDDDSESTEGDLTHQEGSTEMTNVFDQNGIDDSRKHALTHAQLTDIVAKAKATNGHFKDAVLAHAAEYGITDIDMLFPDAKAITQTPQFLSRRREWVATVLNGTKHSPLAKVKTLLADITADEARAKGYTKGNRKTEEVFGLLKRSTGPATMYKKQKLDRDDMLDITDMDVVNWLKAEMRLMIEEELARAILVGDGRPAGHEDKVKDPAGALDGNGIRSILNDDDLYAIKVSMPSNVMPKAAVKQVVTAMDEYRGTGSPTMFMSRKNLTEILLEDDKFERPLYADRQALADKFGVSSIVPVDLFSEYDGLFGIIVSLNDYQIGTGRGGELTSFEDFDIDFNQYKYLQETRLSGGLTVPYSAIVIFRQQGTEADPTAPSFDGATDDITIPTSTGVSYFIDGEEVTGTVHITGQTTVDAQADDGYYIPAGTNRTWTYAP